MPRTTSTIIETTGALLAGLIVCTPVPARADEPVLRVVAVERFGDPHAGTPSYEGARCELRTRAGWWCARYVSSRTLLSEGLRARRRLRFTRLPLTAAATLRTVLAETQALGLPDAVGAGTHAATTSVYLEAGTRTHSFRLSLTLGGPLPDRPQDRAAAAIWEASFASGAKSRKLD